RAWPINQHPHLHATESPHHRGSGQPAFIAASRRQVYSTSHSSSQNRVVPSPGFSRKIRWSRRRSFLIVCICVKELDGPFWSIAVTRTPVPAPRDWLPQRKPHGCLHDTSEYPHTKSSSGPPASSVVCCRSIELSRVCRSCSLGSATVAARMPPGRS